MADLIRVGLVGATLTEGGSGWGSGAHVPALKALPEFQIKAVCTAHEATAKASAAAFGADLAFHDFDAMVANPDIDLIAVVVRVPKHYELVKKALEAGKAVYCEWPLGNGLKEGEELAELARKRSLANMVGLQARSDPGVRYAQELMAQGYVGEVLHANLRVTHGARVERGPGRIWQGIRSNGANPLTIPGGHSMDMLSALLGDFAEVSARIATRIPEWIHAETGKPMAVDAPDVISVAARMKSNAEVSIQIASAPSNAPGLRLEIFGLKGTLLVTCGSTNIGPNKLQGAQGEAKLADLPIPDRLRAAPAGVPAGSPQNVAHAYARFAEARSKGTAVDPGFDTALRMHRVVDAIERSAVEKRSIEI